MGQRRPKRRWPIPSMGNFNSLVLGICSYSSLNSDWSSQCGKACCFLRHQQDEEESNGGKICSLLILKMILFECLSECLAPSKIIKGEQRGWETTNRGGPKFYQVVIHQFNLFSNVWQFFFQKGNINSFYQHIWTFCALDISRRGIVGDWKTHFTSEQSQDWDRLIHWLYNEEPRSSM